MKLFRRILPLFILPLLILSFSPQTVSAADIPTFDISRYQVEGNTILPVAEVERILMPFAGKRSDFGVLQQAVEALEEAYRNLGFHAVKVVLPEQELKGGVVKLNIIEVRIGTVAVDGNKYFDKDNIRNSLLQLKEGTVPNLDRISMSIRVANENPSRKTQMTLHGGDSEDKTNALLKVVDDKLWKIGTTLDNTGNSETGDLRLALQAQYANLFNMDHLLTFQYTTSPAHWNDVNIYNLGYRIPLYRLGDSLDLYGGYSDVDSGTVSVQTSGGEAGINVSGKGTFAGIRYNQNLLRIGSYEHRILYGVDYRLFENNIDFAGTPLGTSTASHPFNIGYSGSYAFRTGTELSLWSTLSQNIPGGANGGKSDYEKIRIDAPPTFTVLRAGTDIRISLPADIQTRLNLNGQYATVPLIPGEQFGVGGESSLRGFDERELTNDYGFSTTFEIYSPNILKLFSLTESRLNALAFLDSAVLGRNKSQPGEIDNMNAASTGVGLRLVVANNIAASFDYAFVITPEGKREMGDSRSHFRVQFNF
ncbi:MAG: ShlB/FhaC/HecB family hemolysin secretion/activation protein [Desulfuromonadaceae bacterium]|nr:ShlB/FhaC/HecB family hemolysin secretion/activation protein [Desulfuromonadaceae bacterium]